MDALKEKYVGKYIGEDKIADIEVSDFTTMLGSTVFELTYENGKKKIIPEKGLAVTASDEKKDLVSIYTILMNNISEECVKIVEEYDIPSFLFDRVGAKIDLELKNHLQRAASIVWFGNAGEYAPGFDSSNNVTLLMADRINRKVPVNENVAG